ncbi:MAG: glucose 1-dehydrogenase [Betaproteobacteria bacterium]|jgi:NAD(P)-dependent dehydrogenase (short-subunit alcohol dehydrogenase family)|nr:glucose 1-dehydrogenase [Betaproteobacteria bacterium]
MHRLSNKVIAVTGGAQGIGRACVERASEEGAAVAVLDILDREGVALVADLRAKGRAAEYWHCNVAQEADVKSALDAAAGSFGGLHGLVNNAGIAGMNQPTHEITEAQWDQVQSVNVKGVFFATKHALPHLFQAKGASVVNISSIAGLVGLASVPPYHASKGAVRLMTKNDAIQYASKQIRFNSIHPGYIWTAMVENHLKSNSPNLQAAKAAVAAAHPLGRMGSPDDIAWCAVYLLSDESAFVTGAEFVIDGGYTAR